MMRIFGGRRRCCGCRRRRSEAALYMEWILLFLLIGMLVVPPVAVFWLPYRHRLLIPYLLLVVFAFAFDVVTISNRPPTPVLSNGELAGDSEPGFILCIPTAIVGLGWIAMFSVFRRQPRSHT